MLLRFQPDLASPRLRCGPPLRNSHGSQPTGGIPGAGSAGKVNAPLIPRLERLAYPSTSCAASAHFTTSRLASTYPTSRNPAMRRRARGVPLPDAPYLSSPSSLAEGDPAAEDESDSAHCGADAPDCGPRSHRSRRRSLSTPVEASWSEPSAASLPHRPAPGTAPFSPSSLSSLSSLPSSQSSSSPAPDPASGSPRPAREAPATGSPSMLCRRSGAAVSTPAPSRRRRWRSSRSRSATWARRASRKRRLPRAGPFTSFSNACCTCCTICMRDRCV